MATEKKTGPWTAVIQGTGSFDSGDEQDIEQRIEEFCKQLNIAGHSVSDVRLSVGNERRFDSGQWQHSHRAVSLSGEQGS